MMIYGPKEIFSRFSVSFVSLPECQFDVKLNVGGRQKNYDISKIHKVSDFIESTLKKLIYKNAVVPNRYVVLFFNFPD